ncbi:thiolase domain-containing protein [Candidatus Micrarchaeota archaeon]|nr:thiolase domain-containing protein [Candidatus Micrarchaeota archaeon]MBU1166404.1 thiolase domain-containing protein [Candidatus Micrarchaeota archaeon]MBU1886913.1 thiolase domain-containing protein [Candidatus Micrarchaeota archaeon]
MRKVAIIGAGMTPFGEHWGQGFRDMVVEAGVKALTDAGISGDKIDAGYIGTMASGRLIGQEHIGGLLADYMGLNPIPITRVEGACASGSLALRQGFMAVASGMHDIVVVGGVEKMTDLGINTVSDILGGAGDQEWELFLGATFPAIYALMARRHMYEFGTTEEMLASVAVKNHKHGAKNKYAQFRKEITIEDVMKSKEVSAPLKMLDCSPITDGAAGVILAPMEIAESFAKKPVEIITSAQASDTIALHSRKSLTSLNATKVAAKNAYKMAGLTPKDLDVVEVHDCFTIAEIMAIEDLGLFEKGQGGPASLAGKTALGGQIPVNTSGGLKACGHPVGATGIKQAVEISWQLRGEAEGRQVKDAHIGLSHNVGGSGATAVVHIYKSD